MSVKKKTLQVADDYFVTIGWHEDKGPQFTITTTSPKLLQVLKGRKSELSLTVNFRPNPQVALGMWEQIRDVLQEELRYQRRVKAKSGLTIAPDGNLSFPE